MLTGTDSAPVKANEAAQKNDIGAAKDQIYLDVQDAQTDAYINVYVEPGTAKGSAPTSVGQKVINKILEKYSTVKTTGKASIQAEQSGAEADGKIRIWTTDFEVEGTIDRNGGALSWGDIEANTPGLKISLTSTTINEGENKPIEVTFKGIPAGTAVSWTSGDDTKATVAKNSSDDTKATITGVAATTSVTITATAGGYSAECTVTVQADPNAPTRTIALTSSQNFGVLKDSTTYNLPSDKNTIVTKSIEVTTETGTETQTQQIVIPAGFIVPSSSADTLEGGMVIKHNTDENEFVWIPVNQPVQFASNAGGGIGTITLARYTFGTKSSPSISDPIAESTPISTYYTEGNIARSISDFKSNSNNAKGYYIGRYEMGIEGATVNTSTKVWSVPSGSTKKVVCQSGKKVYNYISRTNAISEAQGLYNGIKKGDTEIYTSDLVNSLAWDTAIVYIIKCGGISGYAFLDGYHTGGPYNTGAESDTRCNINDMAKNVREWTTETSSSPSGSCVDRGGSYINSKCWTSVRSYSSDKAYGNIGFRPLIYISSAGS